MNPTVTGILLAALATALRHQAFYWIPGFRTYLLHMLLVVLVAQYGGTRAALAATLASVVGITFFTPRWDYGHMARNDFLALTLFAACGAGMSLFSGHYSRVLRELRLTNEALRNERQLRGLLPTCAHCKKIRDPDGKWHQIEFYISQNSPVQFSHTLCDHCLPLYSEASPPHSIRPGETQAFIREMRRRLEE